MQGAFVCSAHGGKAPQVKAAAEERLLQERAQRELARFSGAAPVINPLEALQALAGEADAWKRACEERVQELQAVRFTSSLGIEQLRAEVGMYERAVARCESLCAAMARLGIDERLVAVREATGAMIVNALREALSTGGLEGETARVVRADFARRLRVLGTSGECQRAG